METTAGQNDKPKEPNKYKVSNFSEEFKQWRPVFYKLAWIGLSYPESSLAKSIENGKFFQGMKKTTEAFQLELSQLDGISKEAFEAESVKEKERELETEYVSLFISEVGGALVPPYGSVYIDDTIMGPSTDRVVENYQEAGFSKLEEYNGLPDHISVELEYLFKLTQMETPEKYRYHIQFYDDLLAPWLGEFTDSIVEAMDSRFYSTLATWLESGLRKDRKFLGDLLDNNEDKAGTNGG